MAVGELELAVEVLPGMLEPQALRNSRQARSVLARDNTCRR